MKKILVGMSGGVDSSVSALLLKKQGYEVVGATMVLYDENNSSTLTSSLAEDAKKVCDKLGIEHHIIDLRKEFKCHVINNFIDSYKQGLTPNPCVQCNKYLKFGCLWEKAQELGCEYMATGHYARQIDGKILKSNSFAKDQSYFLYGINKKVISHIIFPLEDFTDKEKVRQIARDNDLFVANKKDSQDVCFIPNGDYSKFLEDNMDKLPDCGDFILKDGTILGKHKSIIYYTIGQRKGLGISYEKPLYVIDINKNSNSIILGDEEDLYQNSLYATNINFLVDNIPNNIMAKIRFKSPECKAKLERIDDNNVKVIFEKPQRAITKGQSVVFYNKNILLGGGIIK